MDEKQLRTASAKHTLVLSSGNGHVKVRLLLRKLLSQCWTVTSAGGVSLTWRIIAAWIRTCIVAAFALHVTHDQHTEQLS